MKLLIITQKVDQHDPILGFFHRWIQEFAKHCESVTVIGQLVGFYDLPSNVQIFSLGKENGRSIPLQILRFLKLQWQLRRSYDVALVHMTPVWVLIGAPVWLLLRKPIFLWYEHSKRSFKLSFAFLFTRKVFSATKRGAAIGSKKSIVLGHAIDTVLFHPAPEKCNPLRFATLGRLTRVKHLPVMLKAFASLDPSHHFFIGGVTITQDDKRHLQELHALIEELHLQKRVTIAVVPSSEAPSFLAQTSLYLHAASGGLDKAILEAMASGCLILSASEATVGLLPVECQCTREGMAEALQKLFALPEERKNALRVQLRAIVERDHNLMTLIEKLMREMSR